MTKVGKVTVTFTGFELTGADKDNYVLAAQPDPTTADIIAPNAEVISVDISWDSMEFTYIAPGKGTWNPETHDYENATEGSWAATSGADPKITVTNHSNVDVSTSFAFQSSVDGLTGSFTKDTIRRNTADGTDVNDAPKGETSFSVSGSGIDARREIGTITVTVQKNAPVSVSTETELQETASPEWEDCFLRR